MFRIIVSRVSAARDSSRFAVATMDLRILLLRRTHLPNNHPNPRPQPLPPWHRPPQVFDPWFGVVDGAPLPYAPPSLVPNPTLVLPDLPLPPPLPFPPPSISLPCAARAA